MRYPVFRNGHRQRKGGRDFGAKAGGTGVKAKFW
jgi:hypothetical protein